MTCFGLRSALKLFKIGFELYRYLGQFGVSLRLFGLNKKVIGKNDLFVKIVQSILKLIKISRGCAVVQKF